MSYHIATQTVHAGREDLTRLGVHAAPIDLSSTYPTPDPALAGASLDALVAGAEHAPNPVYARLHNPTVARFEHALATLEGAEQAVAFGSGMAALTAVLLALQERGRHIVAVRPLYGGSDHLLATGLLGTTVSFVNADEVADAIRADTALVLIETPANPTLNLVDIADVVRQAGAVPVLVDSTFATPILQRPLEHGAAMVLHSATKFLGGHGDVVAGVVACRAELAGKLRQVRILTGAILHPLGAFLLLRGLATLRLRVLAAEDNAVVLATRLAKHPDVAHVHYPARSRGKQAAIMQRQMSGPGCVLAFELRPGVDADRMLQSLRLITPAVSLGSVDTLIQRPAALTHRVVDPKARAASGVSEGLLRLSVGIEDAEDLWADLKQAIEASGHGMARAA
jgi:methionine-gamma-lyase